MDEIGAGAGEPASVDAGSSVPEGTRTDVAFPRAASVAPARVSEFTAIAAPAVPRTPKTERIATA